MARIKVRCPAGVEYSFSMGEEFAQIIRLGSITAAWEVFHEMKHIWLPMALHPLFRTLSSVEGHDELIDLRSRPLA